MRMCRDVGREYRLTFLLLGVLLMINLVIKVNLISSSYQAATFRISRQGVFSGERLFQVRLVNLDTFEEEVSCYSFSSTNSRKG